MAVPPQKWMNFYTTVVSRFASAPGLKLTVGLEVPVAPDQTKPKTDETDHAIRTLHQIWYRRVYGRAHSGCDGTQSSGLRNSATVSTRRRECPVAVRGP